MIWLIANFSICYGQSLQTQKNALNAYVNEPDSTFQWQDYQQTIIPNGTYYEVNLTSQTWHNITWRHRLIIYIPVEAEFPHSMLMVLRHIYNRNAGMASLKIISDSTSTPSAILYDIPNQPLFDGREEDDLQAYTFSRYLKSGDESWPLLFPMVKSVVKAMDAVQYLSQQENKVTINEFVVAGHSKRGHTAWLTAAADARVKGIISIAIDVLNSSAQIPHQLEMFGEFSTPSDTTTDLLRELNHNPNGKRLIEIIDAYSYREKLMLPKLIVSATNDPFFTLDALNLYWDGLKGPKWILYLSNANHVSADSDSRINPTAFAFVRAIAAKKLLPDLRWEFENKKKSVHLKIVADTSATKANVWISYAKHKDFRQAKWTSQPMQHIDAISTKDKKHIKKQSKEFEVDIEIPLNGYIAVFGEIEFVQEGHSLLLSTQVQISPLDR